MCGECGEKQDVVTAAVWAAAALGPPLNVWAAINGDIPNNSGVAMYSGWVANLDKMPASRATIIVGAPKHRGGSGGPARIFAMV